MNHSHSTSHSFFKSHIYFGHLRLDIPTRFAKFLGQLRMIMITIWNLQGLQYWIETEVTIHFILWRIDPFLGDDSETNKTTAVARQQILNKQHLNYKNRGTVGKSVFYSVRAKGLYNEDTIPCGGRFEHFHRSPASRTRWRKVNPVSGGITWPPCSWGIKMRRPGPPRLRETRIWDNKMWSWHSRDSDLRMNALARINSNYKERPTLSTERVSHEDYNRKCSVGK
jgi:hypothetical protein